MGIVLAIDPGPTQSAFVLFDGARVVDHGHCDNPVLLKRLCERTFGAEPYVTVIEQIESFGMPAGGELFETCFWSGRFAQASRPFDRVTRKVVKRHLCGTLKSNDADVRSALLKRFGVPAKFNGHKFSALAVAVTWCDQRAKETA